MSYLDGISKRLEGFVIAVDFDGTCVEHRYPEIGRSIGAEPVLAALSESGAKLILWTMRSGDKLHAAVQWFSDRNIPLWGVNSNPEQKDWTGSPKAYAHLYIDDGALGVPLVRGEGARPYVDWIRVREVIEDMAKNVFIEPIIKS